MPEQPDAQYRQQKGDSVAAGCEQIAKGSREGWEGKDQPGGQRLHPSAADGKDADQNAHGNGQQNQGNYTVNPGHGYIGEQGIQCSQPPPAGDHGGAFGKQALYLVMIHKLVGKGEGVGQKAEYQRGHQGNPVGVPQAGQRTQDSLKEQRMGCIRLHRQKTPFFLPL